MRAMFRRSIIVGAKAADGISVAVGAIRQYTDAGRTRFDVDGAVLVPVLGKNGERCDVILSPEEALQLGPLLCAAGVLAANELPPVVQAPASTLPPKPNGVEP